MKKKLIISLIISFAISIILFSINMIYALLNNKVLLGYTTYGGEYSASSGFGVVVETFYPLSLSGEGSVSSRIVISIIDFIIPFVILFVLIFAISLLFHKNEKKKNGLQKHKNN